MKLKNEGLNDLEIVSSELVKFLLTNTGYDSIETLERKVAQLVTTSSDHQKAVKGATSSATTSANKVDDLKKQVAALERRLAKLEK